MGRINFKKKNASTNRPLPRLDVLFLTGSGVLFLSVQRNIFFFRGTPCASAAILNVSTFDRDAHAAGGSFDDPHRVLFIAGVEIDELSFRDLLDLILGHLEALVLAGLLFLLLGR